MDEEALLALCAKKADPSPRGVAFDDDSDKLALTLEAMFPIQMVELTPYYDVRVWGVVWEGTRH